MTDTPTLSHLMDHFFVQHYVFVGRAREWISFGAQPGTAIRGAIYHALVELFSPNDPIPNMPLDPVRQLLEAEDETNPRGRNLPRAFTVEPPPPNARYGNGQRFEFGLSLFGSALVMAPYLFRAVHHVSQHGIGQGRGRFELERIAEYNPLNRTRRDVMHHERVFIPRLHVSHRRIVREIAIRNTDRILVNFLSPMRLIEGGRLVRVPHLGTLLRRLIERAQSLVENYSTDAAHVPSQADWRAEWERIGELGDAIQRNGLLFERTEWLDVTSFSQKRGRGSPIGGFVGRAGWRIPQRDVVQWLLWGQSLHVGKNTPKGDGYFILE